MSDDLKKQAAQAALAHVRGGMKLGLGTGSTAAHFIEGLAARVRAGLAVIAVPTSEETARLARGAGIELSTLDETPRLDLTVDGADEIGPGLALIKGAGGALLREKMIANASQRMLVIADESKVVDTLGAFALPIEVVSFGLSATRIAIETAAGRLGLEGELHLRQRAGQIFRTDGGNMILDASFGPISDPQALASALAAIPGVVEHGLFIGLASTALVAGGGGVREIKA
ncbi:MAG: ribose-5-phosphate isomerase RpiA [Alphaproteobacteria bacterium]|nr:MAG: ribose-5-phosphate isomerase RpiA [Alphaproteobacteria bacterium]